MRTTTVVPRFFALMALTLCVAFAVSSLEAGDGGPGAEEAVMAPPSGVVAYYFHGKLRCSTCRKLEALSREAITTGFAKDLDSGKLAFMVVNVETPETEHFVQDFQLTNKSLVLVEYRDGTVVRWKNLPKIWQLVRDPEAFVRYVQEETRTFLGEG